MLNPKQLKELIKDFKKIKTFPELDPYNKD